MRAKTWRAWSFYLIPTQDACYQFLSANMTMTMKHYAVAVSTAIMVFVLLAPYMLGVL